MKLTRKVWVCRRKYNGESIAEVLRRAFMFAEAPPGGPTFVTFSHDLWAKKVKRAEIIPRSRSNVDQLVPPSGSHVKKIINNLLQARRDSRNNQF